MYTKILDEVAELMHREKITYEVAVDRLLQKYSTMDSYQKIQGEAKYLMAKDPRIAYGDAVEQVVAAHPDWYLDYSTENRNKVGW
jgi:Asp-tRNA(Asn)/Glu-tRNA(Gln) amidotransferase B subunit